VIALTSTTVSLYVRYSRRAPEGRIRAPNGTCICACAPCAPGQLPLNHLYCLTVYFVLLAVARFYLLKSPLVFALNVHLHMPTPERDWCAVLLSRSFPSSFLTCLLRVHRIHPLHCSFNSAHRLLALQDSPTLRSNCWRRGHTEHKLEPGTPAKGSRTFSRLVHSSPFGPHTHIYPMTYLLQPCSYVDSNIGPLFLPRLR